MTSSQEGLSKSDGLFAVALKKIDASPKNVVYVEDSMERDIVPAQALGTIAIHLSLDLTQDCLAISSLVDLSEATM